MKCVRLFLLAAVIVFGAAGCSEDEVKTTSNDPLYPDVVTTYQAPSTNADAIAFEDVTATLGDTKLAIPAKFTGYIRNVGEVTTKSFEVKYNLTDGDTAIQNTSSAALTATILEPGMKTEFSGALAPAGRKQVTLTYWGVDGKKTTQKYTMTVQ